MTTFIKRDLENLKDMLERADVEFEDNELNDGSTIVKVIAYIGDPLVFEFNEEGELESVM